MAVTKYVTVARKIQTACNKKFGVRLLINTRQWYSKEKDRAVTYYTVIRELDNKETGTVSNVELFKTYSQIQLILFLRDYWYTLNGWEVPHENEAWEEVKNQRGITQQTTDNN